MHESSINLMKYFVKKYLSENSLVLDFGGTVINGSYKNIIEEHKSIYKTLDWNNADYIVKEYDWSEVPINYFDAVISGQVFEHDPYFWKTLENISNVLKKDGLVIIIIPTKGYYHRFPMDCYRFYPDISVVFSNILKADVVEVIWNNSLAVNAIKKYKPIFEYQFDTTWGDLGMVFKKKN